MAKKSDRQECSDDWEWVLQRRAKQADVDREHDILTPGSKRRIKELIQLLEDAVDDDASYQILMWYASDIVSGMAVGFNFYRPKKEPSKRKIRS